MSTHVWPWYSGSSLMRVKFIRRVLLVLSIAGSVAGVLRLRGKGGVPAQTGGWQEVTPQR
ncbi:MAG: hypothetical protein RL430_1895 [Actinomycetota bacterium]